MKDEIIEYEKKVKTYRAALKNFNTRIKAASRTTGKGKAKATDTDDAPVTEADRPIEPTPPKPPSPSNLDIPLPRIKPGEMENFMKLSAALTILLGRSITKENLDRGCTLLQEYLLGFREVRDRFNGYSWLLTYSL